MPAPDGTCGARTYDTRVLRHGPLTTSPLDRTIPDMDTNMNTLEIFVNDNLLQYACYYMAWFRGRDTTSALYQDELK